MKMLKKYVKNLSPERILISHAAHLITTAEIALDNAKETARGKKKIGTTGQGIGPAYVEKSNRTGLRMEIMFDHDQAADLVAEHIQATNKILKAVYGLSPLPVKETAKQFKNYAKNLKLYIKNTSDYLLDVLKDGRKVLAEGAQGALLDVDHGTYPYVTSSNTTIGGVFTGLGIPPQKNSVTIGVVKSFCTRVGAGPFPTKITGELAEKLRGSGKNQDDEYGTTTGRPRDVGYLDLVLLKRVIEQNGVDVLAVTKFDFLTRLKEIKICTDHRFNFLQDEGLIPFNMANLDEYTPVYPYPYITIDQNTNINGLRKFSDAPTWLKKYWELIEGQVGKPIIIGSVGPERGQNIKI